jgi:ribonucleoside-diphosphate reductase alpha chain
MSCTRSRLPERRAHEAFDFEHDGFRYKAGVGFYGDDRIAEVFLDVNKAGTALQTHARDAAVVLSLLLQHGCPLDVIRHAVTRLPDGTAAGPIGTLLDLLAKREIAES